MNKNLVFHCVDSVAEWTNNCRCVFTKILTFYFLPLKIVYLVLLAKRVSLWLATLTVSAGTVHHWKNKDEATPTVEAMC